VGKDKNVHWKSYKHSQTMTVLILYMLLFIWILVILVAVVAGEHIGNRCTHKHVYIRM